MKKIAAWSEIDH